MAFLSQAPEADALHPANVSQTTMYDKFNDIFYDENVAGMRPDGIFRHGNNFVCADPTLI